MMLKENSGMPPPRISSSPRTPVGSLWMVTLAGLPMTFFGGLSLTALLNCFTFSSFAEIQIVERNFRPDLAHQVQRQVFADEGHQQSEQLGQQNNPALEKI